MLKILSTALVVTTVVAPVATAQDTSNESPEDVVRTMYSLLSFDPNDPIDRERFGEHFAEDALVGFGTGLEDLVVAPVGEFLDEVEQRVRAGELGGVGHTIDLQEVECSPAGAAARCHATYRVVRPGAEAQEFDGGTGILLKRRDGRWLINVVFWVVEPPEEAEIEPTVEFGLSWLPTARGDIEPTPGRTWNRTLPILGKKVVELGFDLPNPYGLALIPTWTRQDLELTQLSIAVNGGDEIPIEFLEFGQIDAESVSAQLKFDFWLLPFLNILAAVGKVDGESRIPLSLQGRDLMDLIGVGGLCDGLLAPESCFRTYSATARPQFNGENYSLGLTAAMGYRQFFFALPVTWTWSDLDIVEQTVESFYIAPRIGLNAPTKKSGALSVYLGGAYLDATAELTGSFTFDTSDIPDTPDETTLSYRITQSNKDKWNFLVGFNWDVSRSWSAQFEASAGGSREQIIASGTWRF